MLEQQQFTSWFPIGHHCTPLTSDFWFQEILNETMLEVFSYLFVLFNSQKRFVFIKKEEIVV